MNTIVSYVIGAALFIAALFLPHKTDATVSTTPIKMEERLGAMSIHNSSTQSFEQDEKLE